MRTFEQDVSSRRANLAVRAADDAANRNRTLSISDDAGLAIKRSHDTVEARDLLARRSAPHSNRFLRDVVEIEGVQGMAERQHGVVGGVDQIVDGLVSNRLQPS